MFARLKPVEELGFRIYTYLDSETVGLESCSMQSLDTDFNGEGWVENLGGPISILACFMSPQFSSYKYISYNNVLMY